MKIRVYYEDTDCAGVVYYANYLRYFERARTTFLEQRGVSVAVLLQQGVQFLVAHAEVDYRSPARYGEKLLITTWIADHSQASMVFAHTIHEEKSRRLVVEGSARLVATSLDGSVRRLPKALLAIAQAPSRRASRVRSIATMLLVDTTPAAARHG